VIYGMSGQLSTELFALFRLESFIHISMTHLDNVLDLFPNLGLHIHLKLNTNPKGRKVSDQRTAKVKKRVTAIHSSYCKYCPSNRFPDDDESKMIASMPDGIKQKYVFVCAWRTNKLCRGVCESLDYDEKKHSHLLNEGIKKSE